METRINSLKKTAELKKCLEKITSESLEFAETLRDAIKSENLDPHEERAATVEILRMVTQKWVIEIIHTLFLIGDSRYNDLLRNLPGISTRTLSHKLKLLEDTGLVERNVVQKRPMISEYCLSSKGRVLATLSTPLIYYLKTTASK